MWWVYYWLPNGELDRQSFKYMYDARPGWAAVRHPSGDLLPPGLPPALLLAIAAVDARWLP